MNDKLIKNQQSMQLLSYGFTLGFGYADFTLGKGVFGPRATCERSKDPAKVYTADDNFKNKDFIIIEAIKPIELISTISNMRQKAESFVTSPECMYDFFMAQEGTFMTEEDAKNCALNWHEKVGKKLLGNPKIYDFAKLNNFVLGSFLLYCPLQVSMTVAKFRQEHLLNCLTQGVISPDFAKRELDLFPYSQEKLVASRQKLLQQKQKVAEQQQTPQVQKPHVVYNQDTSVVINRAPAESHDMSMTESQDSAARA